MMIDTYIFGQARRARKGSRWLPGANTNGRKVYGKTGGR